MHFFHTQPAYKMYIFDRGWRIIRSVTKHVILKTDRIRWEWFDKADIIASWAETKSWFIRLISWYICVWLRIAGLLQYLPALIFLSMYILFVSFILCTGIILALLCILSLTAVRFFYRKINRISLRCYVCHKEFAFPIHICSICSTEHSWLLPGLYGILFHRCTGCDLNMPTLRILGRKKLQGVCPHCHHNLHQSLGEGNSKHIALVGSSSAGKTTHLVMALHALQDLYSPYGKHQKYTLTIADPAHEQQFRTNIRTLEAGKNVNATKGQVPQATLLKMQRSLAPLPGLIYMYDPPGSAFATNSSARLQKYYHYLDGIIFTIDPGTLLTQNGNTDQLTANHLAVMRTYECMLQMIEASLGVPKWKRYALPIAIVVTKIDALHLEDTIGLPAVRNLIRSNRAISSEGDASHKLVRDFLCAHNMEHFVRDVESHFTHVHYFACTMPEQTSDETAMVSDPRVADPLLWLFRRTKVISSR